MNENSGKARCFSLNCQPHYVNQCCRSLAQEDTPSRKGPLALLFGARKRVLKISVIFLFTLSFSLSFCLTHGWYINSVPASVPLLKCERGTKILFAPFLVVESEFGQCFNFEADVGLGWQCFISVRNQSRIYCAFIGVDLAWLSCLKYTHICKSYRFFDLVDLGGTIKLNYHWQALWISLIFPSLPVCFFYFSVFSVSLFPLSLFCQNIAKANLQKRHTTHIQTYYSCISS